MCGIAGFYNTRLSSNKDHSTQLAHLLTTMGNTINNRGPDDSGIWLDENNNVGLTHRRLAIVDLSAAGHQPMQSRSERYIIIFNGEIYNHLKLRIALEKANQAPLWKGHSDTETLLAMIEAWGLEVTLQHCIGMFAIALWDKQTQTLTLARDRMGEKPLYYGWQGNTFLFGSELKALKAHPAFAAEVDRNTLCLYMRHGYIPAPYSIYQNIFKLMPGCLLRLSAKQRDPTITSYWSATETAIHGTSQPYTLENQQLVTNLESLLFDAVGQQMLADVPLGAFLSGGIDSSVVVALMQAQSDRPIQTFSIGFYDKRYNEADHAKKVAHYLGTEHTELYVTPEDSMTVIPQLPSLYDEPFADSSQIPTYLVSHLARQHVTVSLSGDGGDELFAGYSRYPFTVNTWKKLSYIPRPLRQLTAKSITQISPLAWNKTAGVLNKHWSQTGDKLHKGATVIASQTLEDLSLGIASCWHNPNEVVIGGTEPNTLFTGDRPNLNNLNDIERLSMLDQLLYLPDDILCKVDRAAMGISLESRAPLLDHRVVEFAWHLPMKYKVRDGTSKWLLRQVLYNHVPKQLIERPKMGFCVPIDNWLRGSLREWAESLLDESRLQHDGYFNPAPIRKKWQEHLKGTCNWQRPLWNVLMFNAWLDSNDRNLILNKNV